MKILEVIPSLRPGGGERLVTDLCNELSIRHEVILLTLWDDNNRDCKFYKNELSDNVKYVNAHVAENDKIAVMLSMARHIRKIKPDVVHLHMCHMFALKAILQEGWKCRFYLTIHNDVKSSYSKLKHKLLFNFLGRLGLLRFVTISQTNYKDFTAIYPHLRNDLIYNGRAAFPMSSEFARVANEINQMKRSVRTKVFLHIARCNPQKNQKLLVEAFNRFVSEGYDVILLVIGAHFNEGDGLFLKNIACDRIHFLGTRQNAGDYIHNSDVFCLSSLFEGMPITLIESINCGIPVISTPVCGVIDVIQNGKNGFLSKVYSIESYLKCMKDFIENEQEVKKYCSEHRNDGTFSIQHCGKQYEKLFVESTK